MVVDYYSSLWALLIAASTVLPSAATSTALSELSSTLVLKRTLSMRTSINELKAYDQARYDRIQQASAIDFVLNGSSDPFNFGLYYTTVKIGTPPQEFHVQVDTGSDVLWVNCAGCSGCPTTSTSLEGFDPNFYDASKSSTGQVLSCSDEKCKSGVRTSESRCDSRTRQCGYKIHYEDNTHTLGHYFKDVLKLDVVSNTETTSYTASIVFGCSMFLTGYMTTVDRPMDGIFGFGKGPMSVFSQLYLQRIAPPAFSHCLRGDSNGGGILTLGEIVEPGMVYTPLVPNRAHYTVYMGGVSVNGQFLPIGSSVFETSSVIDSGTTLAYLPEAIYTPLLNVINIAAPQSTILVPTELFQCYLITSSLEQSFPTIGLKFKGGASIDLGPHDYLFEQNFTDGRLLWCMGFLKGHSITILGDLVLKNKAVVYDLARQRIGWVDYDCSGTVNVSVNLNATRSTNNGQTKINPILCMKIGVIVTLLLMQNM